VVKEEKPEEEFEEDLEESDGMTIMDEEESEAQKKAMMASMKRQRAQEDDEFPDEVDTPMDLPARTRCQRVPYKFGLLPLLSTARDQGGAACRIR
jgi:pre-rRNA-processing protein TSR1